MQVARRSSRPRRQVNYDEEQLGPAPEALGTLAVDYQEYSQMLLDAPSNSSNCTLTHAGAITAEDLLTSGFKQPMLLKPSSKTATAAALDMQLPDNFSLKLLSQQLGEQQRVPVIDVATQEAAAAMTLGQWCSYWNSSDRSSKPLLNVLSLSLAGTPMQQQVSAPAFVYQLDLVTQAWPQQQQQQQHPSSGSSSSQSGRPRSVLLYTLCSPSGCYTDWHIDFGGSAVWYHMIQGVKVFLAAPPTPDNLLAYESWAGSSSQSRSWLGSGLTGAVQIRLEQGATLLLPPGWPHAVVTLQDSLAVGGNFLVSCHLPTHLDIADMETRLKVKPSCQYPGFHAVMWHAAAHLLTRLGDSLTGGPPAVGGALYPAEMAGVPVLLERLQGWLDEAGDYQEAAGVPEGVEDPAGLLQHLQHMYNTVLGQLKPAATAAAAPSRFTNSYRSFHHEDEDAFYPGDVAAEGPNFTGSEGDDESGDMLPGHTNDMLLAVPLSPLSAGILGNGQGLPLTWQPSPAAAAAAAAAGGAQQWPAVRSLAPAANPAAGLLDWMSRSQQQQQQARSSSFTPQKRDRSAATSAAQQQTIGGSSSSSGWSDSDEGAAADGTGEDSDDWDPAAAKQRSGQRRSKTPNKAGSSGSKRAKLSSTSKQQQQQQQRQASTRMGGVQMQESAGGDGLGQEVVLRPGSAKKARRGNSSSSRGVHVQHDTNTVQQVNSSIRGSRANRQLQQQEEREQVEQLDDSDIDKALDKQLERFQQQEQQQQDGTGSASTSKTWSRLRQAASDSTGAAQKEQQQQQQVRRHPRRQQQRPEQDDAVRGALAAAAVAAASREQRRKRVQEAGQQLDRSTTAAAAAADTPRPVAQQQQQVDQPLSKWQLQRQQRLQQQQRQERQEQALAKGAELAQPVGDYRQPNAYRAHKQHILHNRQQQQQRAEQQASAATGRGHKVTAGALEQEQQQQDQRDTGDADEGLNAALNALEDALAHNDAAAPAAAPAAAAAISDGGNSGDAGNRHTSAVGGVTDLSRRRSLQQQHQQQSGKQRHQSRSINSSRSSSSKVVGGHRPVMTVAGLLAAADLVPQSVAAGDELLNRLQQVLDKELKLQQVIQSGGNSTLRDGGVRLQQQIDSLQAAVAKLQAAVEQLKAEQEAGTAPVQAHSQPRQQQQQQQSRSGERSRGRGDSRHQQRQGQHYPHGQWHDVEPPQQQQQYEWSRLQQQRKRWDQPRSHHAAPAGFHSRFEAADQMHYSGPGADFNGSAFGGAGAKGFGSSALGGGVGAAGAAAAVQALTEAAMAAISEEAAAAEVAVTDKIWVFIPPGRGRKAAGPYCVRDLYGFLQRNMLPPTHLVTDDEGGLTLPLYCVIEPHSEYLNSTSNQAWKARLTEQQLERERVVRLTQQQMEQERARKMLAAGAAAAAVVEAHQASNQQDAVQGHEGYADDDDGGGFQASPYDAFWDLDEFAADPPPATQQQQKQQQHQQQEALEDDQAHQLLQNLVAKHSKHDRKQHKDEDSHSKDRIKDGEARKHQHKQQQHDRHKERQPNKNRHQEVGDEDITSRQQQQPQQPEQQLGWLQVPASATDEPQQQQQQPPQQPVSPVAAAAAPSTAVPPFRLNTQVATAAGASGRAAAKHVTFSADTTKGQSPAGSPTTAAVAAATNAADEVAAAAVRVGDVGVPAAAPDFEYDEFEYDDVEDGCPWLPPLPTSPEYTNYQQQQQQQHNSEASMPHAAAGADDQQQEGAVQAGQAEPSAASFAVTQQSAAVLAPPAAQALAPPPAAAASAPAAVVAATEPALLAAALAPVTGRPAAAAAAAIEEEEDIEADHMHPVLNPPLQASLLPEHQQPPPAAALGSSAAAAAADVVGDEFEPSPLHPPLPPPDATPAHQQQQPVDEAGGHPAIVMAAAAAAAAAEEEEELQGKGRGTWEDFDQDQVGQSQQQVHWPAAAEPVQQGRGRLQQPDQAMADLNLAAAAAVDSDVGMEYDPFQDSDDEQPLQQQQQQHTATADEAVLHPQPPSADHPAPPAAADALVVQSASQPLHVFTAAEPPPQPQALAAAPAASGFGGSIFEVLGRLQASGVLPGTAGQPTAAQPAAAAAQAQPPLPPTAADDMPVGMPPPPPPPPPAASDMSAGLQSALLPHLQQQQHLQLPITTEHDQHQQQHYQQQHYQQQHYQQQHQQQMGFVPGFAPPQPPVPPALPAGAAGQFAGFMEPQQHFNPGMLHQLPISQQQQQQQQVMGGSLLRGGFMQQHQQPQQPLVTGSLLGQGTILNPMQQQPLLGTMHMQGSMLGQQQQQHQLMQQPLGAYLEQQVFGVEGLQPAGPVGGFMMPQQHQQQQQQAPMMTVGAGGMLQPSLSISAAGPRPMMRQAPQPGYW